MTRELFHFHGRIIIKHECGSAVAINPDMY